MRRTRKLCAIMLDTLGREVMIRRPFRCAGLSPTKSGKVLGNEAAPLTINAWLAR
jgi:hypothetical protein